MGRRFGRKSGPGLAGKVSPFPGRREGGKGKAESLEDRWKVRGAAALVLLVSLILLSSHLDAPFDRNHIGFTGAWYSLSARNFRAYGPARLWGCLSIESGPPAVHPRLYLDHPPMVGLVLAGVFSLFGEGELQARATGLALSLLAAWFFFLYARRLLWGSPWWALFGVLLAVAAPVWSFYGTLVDPHGPGLLLAMGGSLWGASRYEREGQVRDLVWTCSFVALACLYDWAAVLIAGPLGLWFLLGGVRRGKRGALAVWGTWGILVSLLLLQLYLAARAGGGRADLLGPLAKRSSFFGGSLHIHGKTLSLWAVLVQVAKWNWKGLPLPLTLLGWTGALLAGRDAFRKKAPPSALLIWIPLAMGACISLFFLEAAFEHEYLQIYFAPGLGLGTAYLAGRISRLRPSMAGRTRLLAAAFLAFSLFWGFHRSRNRWAAQEPGLARYKEAGAVVAARVPPHKYIISDTDFLPPLAYYARRRIYWDVRDPSLLPSSPSPEGLEPGGVILKGGERSGFLLDWASRRGWKGPLPLAGGDLDLYTPGK